MDFKQLDIDFYEMIESVTDTIFTLDREMRFTYINKQGASNIQKNQRDIIGKYIWEAFTDMRIENFTLKYKEAYEHKKMVEFVEYCGAPLNKWFRTSVYPSKNGLTVYAKDITRDYWKRMIDDESYRALFTQNPSGVISFDMDGNIKSINHAFEMITGYSIELILTHKGHVADLLLLEDLEIFKTSFKEAMIGETITFDFRMRHFFGHIIYCNATLFPIKAMKNIIGVYAVIKDITSLKEMEIDLGKSEQRYRSLKFFNPDGICSFDLNGHLIGVNPAFEKLTGYTFKELKSVELKEIIHPEYYTTFEKHIIEIIELRGSVNSFDISLLNRQGKRIYTLVTLIPIHIDKKLEGFYVIFKDLTKTKQTEDLLIQSEKLNAVGQLAASIVHEVRNPLTSLMGFLQLMKSSSEINQNYYKIMMDELTRIHSITNELLYLAKPTEKKLAKEDLLLIIEDVINLMQPEALLHNFQLNLNIESDVDPIYCDAKQLKQVFINLIKNSMEAMEGRKSGTITVSVANHEDDQVRISFTDEGVGMSPEILNHIGDPFFTTKQKGTGLGLLMTKNIIHNHQGKLKIESEQGQGTTFFIYLPLSQKK